MSILIVYDSLYSNTEKVAQTIGAVLRNHEDVITLRVSEVKPEQFSGLKLLIVGSPTQRFKPTIAISNMLAGIPRNGLKGIRVAAFDTRLTQVEISKTPVLAFFVKLLGNVYAAKSIADRVKEKGGELVVPPEGFYVDGMEGPLSQGELERAAGWAGQILASM